MMRKIFLVEIQFFDFLTFHYGNLVLQENLHPLLKENCRYICSTGTRLGLGTVIGEKMYQNFYPLSFFFIFLAEKFSIIVSSFVTNAVESFKYMSEPSH